MVGTHICPAEQGVIHEKAYYLKAVFSHCGRPTVIFRSDCAADLEITIADDGGLTLRRASVETVEAAAMLAVQHLNG